MLSRGGWRALQVGRRPACTSFQAGVAVTLSNWTALCSENQVIGSRAISTSTAARFKETPITEWRWALALLAGGLGGGLALRGLSGQAVECKAAPAQDEKVYTHEEVAKHKTKESGIWVTYKDGVYDITEFVDLHPGGAARIMLAAGGAIDPFWSMYAQHNTDQVRGMLKEYRIGSLSGSSRPVEIKDPYAEQPSRHPALIVRTAKPYNAETPAELLADQLLTPNELFYKRHHMPVPTVDPASYKLRLEGEGLRTTELSLSDLKTKFKKHSVVATLQCSGNRRHDFMAVKEVKGLDWDVGAISTAVWGGVLLSDVLQYAGLDASNTGEVEHVEFEGLDADVTGVAYAASIPVDKAVSPSGDVLLAYEMNGRELPPDHGYPIRAVVPGVTGARSVKWVGAIHARKDESDSHWQQKDYRSFNPNVDWDTVDWSSAPSLQESPVTSAICSPRPGSAVEGDEFTVKGYAFSGGGKEIIRVDVSADGGKTWGVATLKKVPQKRNRAWAWALWEATLPVPAGQKEVQLCCKAVDSSYNSQPDTPAPIWNLRGICNNSWHRVNVKVDG